jgi:hypothetical protein
MLLHRSIQYQSIPDRARINDFSRCSIIAPPDDAMAHAYKYLTPEQRERAVEASPSSAKYIPEKFRSDDEMTREAVELLREARELADEKRSAEREQQE